MWIPIEQSLLRHPKTKKLKRLLKCSQHEAIGYLVYLWHWVSDYAPDGDISKYDTDTISDGCEWDGEPEEFFNALAQSGFIVEENGKTLINDWKEYAGKFLKRAEEQAKRMRDQRAKEKETSENIERDNNVNITLYERDNNNLQPSLNRLGKKRSSSSTEEREDNFTTTTTIENFQNLKNEEEIS